MQRYNDEIDECASLMNSPEAKQLFGSSEAISARPPSFHPEWLPDPLRAMCEALAANLSVPLDLPACIGLGIASACGCGKIRLNIREDWTEAGQLYMLVVMDSGSAKTPTFKKLTDILFQTQVEENQRRAVQIKQDEAEVEVLKAEKAVAIKKRNTAKARELAEKIANFPAVYPMRRFIGSNVTPEAYPEIMLENNGATAILDDEGDLFELLAGRYQDAPTLDPFLKGYNGSPLESHRRGRPSVVVPKANLSVLILAQPFVVDGVFADSRMVGKGLVPRFLIARPEPLREYGPEPPISAKLKADYEAAVCRMMGVGTHCFTLSAEAQRLFMEFREERREKQFDDWDALRQFGFTGKMEANLARIACALKLWSGVNNDEITAQQMRNAISINRYFIGHTLHMLGPTAKLSERARLVLDHLCQTGSRVVNERDVKQSMTKKKGFRNAAAVDQAITELVENGFVKRYSNSTGGRPSWYIEILVDMGVDVI